MHVSIISTVFISVLGTLLHFTYVWFGNNPLIGAFSAVNESTWEHLKLLFFPSLIVTVVGAIYYRGRVPNYVCSRLKGMLVAMVFIVMFFYTSMGVIGKNYAILNILTFYVAVIIEEYVVWRMIKVMKVCNARKAWIIWGILLICFIIFTYNAPKIGLFKDPITGGYGILGS